MVKTMLTIKNKVECNCDKKKKKKTSLGIVHRDCDAVPNAQKAVTQGKKRDSSLFLQKFSNWVLLLLLLYKNRDHKSKT